MGVAESGVQQAAGQTMEPEISMANWTGLFKGQRGLGIARSVHGAKHLIFQQEYVRIC